MPTQQPVIQMIQQAPRAKAALQAPNGAHAGVGKGRVQIGQAVNDSIHTLSTLPPAALLGIVVALIVGLWVLKRAF
jgi:hypothetical protein